LAGNQAHSLEELNTKLSAWIQTVYHQRPHSATGQSPEYRYQQAAPLCANGVKWTTSNRSSINGWNGPWRKNGTVRLEGQLYEVPLSLRALKIQLRLDPWRRARIEVWYQGKLMGLARLAPLHLNAENGGSQAYER